MQINEFLKENYAEYINDISGWVDDQYKLHFKDCFDAIRTIHEQMKSQTRQITDTELEWTLTELPMQLFSISESLNKVKLESEVIKLRKKTVKADLDKQVAELVKNDELAKTEAKGWVDTELVEHDILLAAYNSLIARVDSEISFSRELIMGCKKIWDARRRTEQSNPVNEVTPSEMPNYSQGSYRNEGRYHEPYIR